MLLHTRKCVASSSKHSEICKSAYKWKFWKISSILIWSKGTTLIYLWLTTWMLQRNQVLPSTLPPKVSIPTAKDFRSGETDLKQKQKNRALFWGTMNNVSKVMLWTSAHAPLHEYYGLPSIAYSNPKLKHSMKFKFRCMASFHWLQCMNSHWHKWENLQSKWPWTQRTNCKHFWDWGCMRKFRWTNRKQAVHVHMFHALL